MGSCTGTSKIKKNFIISCNSAVLDNNAKKQNSSDSFFTPEGETESKESYSIVNPDSSSKELMIELHADREPILIPVFIKKEQQVTLIVVKGDWMFKKELGFTSFRGKTDKIYQKANYGQLMCRVQGGKVMKVDKQTFFFNSDSNGQLIFYPNCDLAVVEPRGKLYLKLKGGLKESTQKEINKFTGYSSLPVYSKVDYPYITKEEFELVEMINKVRTSPKTFSNLFLDKDDCSHQELISFLQKYTEVPPLRINQDLTLAAYRHCNILGTTGTSGHIESENKENISDRVHKFYKNKFNYFGESIMFGKRKALSIIIDMLVDKDIIDRKNRINILNEKFTEIGICIGKHNVYKWCCVILLNNPT